MNPPFIPEPRGPLAKLRRIARSPGAKEAETCDLCSVVLAQQHRHLLELPSRQITCACDPCALRFENVIEGRFKLIPRDARVLPEFQMTDAQWDDLAIPINLAFLFFSTPDQKMTAFYPGPAGATESLLPLRQWEALTAQNPALSRLEPDVEALLVNRVGTARDYFVAPIDHCFELVGVIRIHWRGLSGGDAVWREIDRFFSRLQADSKPLAESNPEVRHAQP